jgi:HEAT repeat protein
MFLGRDSIMGLFKPNVPKLAEKKDVPGLIKALAHKDPEIRAAAANALGELRDGTAVVSLVSCLRDRELKVWREAAEALVKIGKPSVEPLAALIRFSPPLRELAIDTLGKIGAESAVNQLTAAMGNSDVYVRAAATDALGKIGGEKVLEPLIAAFKDANHSVRKAATDGLLKFGKSAIAPLCAVVKDSAQPEYVHWAAAGTVEKIGGSDDPVVQAWCAVAKRDWNLALSLGNVSVEPLILALKDKSDDVRASAITVLGKLGDIKAVDPLIAALTDVGWQMRGPVTEALVKMGAASVDPVIAALKQNDHLVRFRAAEVLGEICDGRSVSPLIALLKDTDEGVRWSAAKALVKMYRSNRLDKNLCQMIFVMRELIKQPHSDSAWCAGFHSDSPPIEL